MTKSLGVICNFLVWTAAAVAQQYTISTFAGGVPPPTPAKGVNMSLQNASGVAVDGAGNVYFEASLCVFKLDANGVVTRIAGNSTVGYSGDGGPATDAQLHNPTALAADSAGNLFIADVGRIRRVSSSGIITTVAGDGMPGFSGEGGPATEAALDGSALGATGVAVDSAGNLFVAVPGQGRVLKVSPGGIITTVAGAGTSVPGDDGPATSAALILPAAVAVDAAGNLFIATQGEIRRVSPSGIITTVAGNGTPGSAGDGGPATSSLLARPRAMAVDRSSDLFISDPGSGRIRKVSPNGIITTIAGNGPIGSGDGGPAAAAGLNNPWGVAVNTARDVFIADGNRVRKVSANGIITTVAGDGDMSFSGDGEQATSAQLNQPIDVAVDGAGNLFIADVGNYRVRKIAPNGIITTVAGVGTLCGNPSNGCLLPADNVPATSEEILPNGVAADSSGDLFIMDINRVRKVAPDGLITTVAGIGLNLGPSGDGGQASSASLPGPRRATIDRAGNLVIATDFTIRKITADGIITTVAGGSVQGFSGDGGPAKDALIRIWDPDFNDWPGGGIASQGDDGFVFADTYNNRVRKVSASGIVTTVAGSSEGYSGDGGPATSANLGEPFGVAFDKVGNLFITDSLNSRVRRVSPDGIISTVAGGGSNSIRAGWPASRVALVQPRGITVDSADNIFFTDMYTGAVYVLRPTSDSVLIDSVAGAASQQSSPISPGEIVVVYGAGLGQTQLIQNQASNGQFSTEAGGTQVLFNGVAAPILYASATQVAAIVPYAISGTTAQVTVSYQGETSAVSTIALALSAPNLFTLNQTGAGQAVALNNVDGTINTAANPAKAGGSISLFATGEGQTVPVGVDGKLGDFRLATPILPVSVTIGGLAATVQYAGSVPGQVAGLMQINVGIPSDVQPGGYVPVVLQVGTTTSAPDAVWIAVSGK